MKKILVPVDFSLNAYKALEFAVQIGKKTNAEIILLHVYSYVSGPFTKKSFIEEKHGLPQDEAIRLELATKKQELENNGSSKVSVRISVGAVVPAIIDTAKEAGADIIVMGTLGDAAFKEKLFGSVSAAVIAKSNVPVLVVPLLAEWYEPSNILMAMNHFEDEVGVTYPVFELAGLFDARVTVAIFADEDKELVAEAVGEKGSFKSFEKRLKNVYKSNRIEISGLYGYQFEETISNYIRRHQVDMIAMFTHKRCISGTILHRSLTKKMSYHTNIPLLAIPVQ